MKLLEEIIEKEGSVLPGHVLKVGSFLNQQVDIELLKAMGEEVKRLFADEPITKVLTIEASGIPFAIAIGMALGVPVVFAKKGISSNVSGSVYSTVVHSYTHNTDSNVTVPSDYLNQGDHVLIADDFLANGRAVEGLLDLIQQAGATLAGVTIQIEKVFQSGGKRLRELGVRVESLAMISSMEDDKCHFVSQPE